MSAPHISHSRLYSLFTRPSWVATSPIFIFLTWSFRARCLLLSPDLASHCRLLLHSRPKHTLFYRWCGLYPLYVLSEVAIIATDLAELLGSAIALCMLFPKLELWHGVLLTAFDVFIILGLGDPLRGRPVRMFELLIAGLVRIHFSNRVLNMEFNRG